MVGPLSAESLQEVNVLLKDDLICEKSPVRVADITIDEVAAKKVIVAEVTILVLG